MTGQPELVVLLDEQGQAVGTADKAVVHDRATPLHLAFSCYVLDDHDRLLLTRRAATKRTWPGVLTNSCCGHPAPGEPLSAAVARRLGDELGTAVTELRLVLPRFRYRAVMSDGTVENEMCPVLVARCPDPGSVRPDPREVDEVEWRPWPDVRRGVLDGALEVSPWCAEQVAALPADLWSVAADPDLLPAATRL